MTDLFLVLYFVKRHLISCFWGQIINFSKKNIVLFRLLIVYAEFFLEIQYFFCGFLFLLRLFAIDNITPIQII